MSHYRVTVLLRCECDAEIHEVSYGDGEYICGEDSISEGDTLSCGHVVTSKDINDLGESVDEFRTYQHSGE